MASKELIYNQQINLIMDEAVLDSLNIAFCDTDKEGLPIVDMDALKDNIINESAIGLLGSIDNETRTLIESRIMFVIYMDKDGYYYYKNGKWSKKIKYISERHEIVIEQISMEIDKIIGKKYRTLIPYNEGEDYKNSIDKYSCLVFYEQLDRYYCFSGARIQLGNSV